MIDLLQLVIETIVSKCSAAWNFLTTWTNVAHLKTVINEKIKLFLGKNLSVKPRDKKDYYTFGSWMVSRRLLHSILLLIGVLGVTYILYMTPDLSLADSGGIRVYAYNSIPLRFAGGEVKIKAKSGYLAYEGEVSGGKANGSGKLYNRENQLVYDGTFADSFYEGSGISYRENGSREYEGEFHLNQKEGSGKLFDSSGNQIFEGNFAKDEIHYVELLGKTAQEMAEMYIGSQSIYMMDEQFVVSLDDIAVVYCGNRSEESLDESIRVEELYVLRTGVQIDGQVCRTAAELKQAYGSPAYEGNVKLKLPEAVAIEKIRQTDESSLSTVNLTDVNLVTESVYTNVSKVLSYEEEIYMYLYTFIRDENVFTYFFQDKQGEMIFYLIE